MGAHVFDHDGAGSGELTVSLDRVRGETRVWTDIHPTTWGFGLTAAGARAYAADLVRHAKALEEYEARGAG